MPSTDLEHLKLLSIFHYVVAGLVGSFSLFPVFHLVFGLLIIFAPQIFEQKGDKPPAFFGWFMVAFALMLITIGLVFAVLILVTARFLSGRRHYMFCLVMAGAECLIMPFGTVLGVFTIVVLIRDSVKEMFSATGRLRAADA